MISVANAGSEGLWSLRKDMRSCDRGKRTDLVKFNSVVLGSDLGQKLLGSFAVWAVGL